MIANEVSLWYLYLYSRHNFGTRSPLYLKALLHLCHFSTEFKQDEPGMHIAMVTNFLSKMLLDHL